MKIKFKNFKNLGDTQKILEIILWLPVIGILVAFYMIFVYNLDKKARKQMLLWCIYQTISVLTVMKNVT
jgi:hypothetical protein